MQVLFLAPGARTQFSSGRIFSHVTSDAETIYQLSTSGLGLLSSPVRIVGANDRAASAQTQSALLCSWHRTSNAWKRQPACHIA